MEVEAEANNKKDNKKLNRSHEEINE